MALVHPGDGDQHEGLQPPLIDLDKLKEALRGKGYETAYVKWIRVRSGRPGCIFFAELSGTPQENAGIYARAAVYVRHQNR